MFHQDKKSKDPFVSATTGIQTSLKADALCRAIATGEVVAWSTFCREREVQKERMSKKQKIAMTPALTNPGFVSTPPETVKSGVLLTKSFVLTKNRTAFFCHSNLQNQAKENDAGLANAMSEISMSASQLVKLKNGK